MRNETNEFSFILKPSKHGIGVFATHDIAKDTYLLLFAQEEDIELESLARPKESVPELFRQFCVDRGNTLYCPLNFSSMPVGWHMNHSKNANARHDPSYKYYATRDIVAGEEITTNYNELGEPEEIKEPYYND